ncbi:MAG TPA: hypothetical protein VJA17_00640 [Candidatus Omnitrophota bacterium]|nr:hypothetical protein [Candidatus Omnitrophota bacterium]
MKIFLSNVPGFILAEELQRNSIKQWIYFGTDQAVQNKLERIFDKKAQQVNYGKKLYEATQAQRKEFVLWIDQIAAVFSGRKEWLFSVPSVKNTCSSHLFLYICYLSLLEDYIKEGKQADFIFVDSPALAALFKDHFSGSIRTAPMNSWLKLGFYFKILIKSILRLGKYSFEFGRKFVSAKIVFKNRSRPLLRGRKKLVLIRNFITGQFLDTRDDMMERHYFPGLYDYLKSKKYAPVFLPIITRASSYRQLYQKVAQSEKMIVFPEEFLKLQDYWYTFLTPLRALLLKLPAPFYGRYQLGPLLREEYYSNLTEYGFLYAMLLFCLGQRFKEQGVVPLGMINWMENQAMERGLVKGLREHFPDIQILGGQPFFMQENYLSPVSSNQERESGLLPERILVLGPAGQKSATEFIKDAPVDYSPPFRYASVISEPLANGRGNNLLVLFTIDFKNAIRVMQTLLKIESHLESFDRIMVKLHPAGYFKEKDLIEALGQNFSNRYEFINGRLEQYINKTAIGFCGATGTAVELVIRGIPVITMGEFHVLTLDFLSCKKDPDMWQLCFSSQEVIDVLNHFKVLKKERPQRFIQKAQEFRDFFIAEPNEQYWENYLPVER